MAFVQISDINGEIELLLFPSTYEQTAWLWEQDKVVLVEGSVNAKDRDGELTDEVKINVSTAREILVEEARAYKERGKALKSLKDMKPPKRKGGEAAPKQAAQKRIYVRMTDPKNTEQLLALKQHINANPGGYEVVLVMGPSDSKQVIRVPERIAGDENCISTLVGLFGPDNVKQG